MTSLSDRESEVAHEIAGLADRDRAYLVARWQRFYGRRPPSKLSRAMLEKAIAYEIQCTAFGGLSTAAKRALRAAASGRTVTPTRHVAAGAHLVREWNGVVHEVDVVEGGYGPEQKIDPERDGERRGRIDDVIVFERPFNGPANGRPARLLLGHALDRPRRDAALIALVANARRWSGMLLSGKATSVLEITEREGLGKGVISRTLPLAFLAPDIAEAILDGRQPDGLTVGGLYRLADLPRDWDAQRKLLGFNRAA